MHIVVKEKNKGRKIRLRFPNWLFANRFVAKHASKALAKYGGKGAPQLTATQMYELFKAIKSAKKVLKSRNMHFVEVSENDGEYVLVDF